MDWLLYPVMQSGQQWFELGTAQGGSDEKEANVDSKLAAARLLERHTDRFLRLFLSLQAEGRVQIAQTLAGTRVQLRLL